MSVERKIFNIDKELNKLYIRKDRLDAEIRQKSQLRMVFTRHANLTTKIQEQLKLRKECQEEVSGKKLRVWLKAEHPEVYEKFFGSEKKEGQANEHEE